MKNLLIAAIVVVVSIAVVGCGCPGKCPPGEEKALNYVCDRETGVCMVVDDSSSAQ